MVHKIIRKINKMTAKNYIEVEDQEMIVDDISHIKIENSETQADSDSDDVQPQQPADPAIDLSKLDALKAKLKNKDKKDVKMKKEKTLKLGFLGSGQAGSRLAETAFNLGYDAIVVNTAQQDLKFINVPDTNKLLIGSSIGGSAKERSLGLDAAERSREEISALVADKLADTDVNVLTLALGGGSGSGSAPVMVDILAATGKPLVAIVVLPLSTDDSQAKHNALEALSEFAKFAQSKKIQCIMTVDNAKIETIFKDVSQLSFYELANKAIIDPIDIFNTFSKMPSPIKSLDGMEFARILTDGGALATFGQMEVRDFKEDIALAEAVINNLDNNLLTGSFDLQQTKYCGVLFICNEEVLRAIPSSSISYAMSVINEKCGSPLGVYRGIYVDNDIKENVVKVYSFFSGLGLPEERIDALKQEAKEFMSKVKVKDDQRNLTLNLDTGKNETLSAAEKVKEKIAQKSSAFGKFSTGMIDRRNKK